MKLKRVVLHGLLESLGFILLEIGIHWRIYKKVEVWFILSYFTCFYTNFNTSTTIMKSLYNTQN